MNFIDYYFYRVYMIYVKKKEFARITTTILFCELFLTAFFFITIFITHYITGDFFIRNISPLIVYSTIFGILILSGIVVYYYYTKKRIKKLQEQYSNSRYNTLISDKLILSVTHIELTIGFILYFLINNT